MPVEERVNLVTFMKWASAPELARLDIGVILVAESANELHADLLRNPHVAQVRIELPDAEERQRFLESGWAEKLAEGKPFAEVLAEAQAAGLAEADPSFDVDGIDTAHKLAILVWLATGGHLPPKEIFVQGIREIDQEDISFAKEFGYTIKLLAIAKENGAGIEARVHPTMIPSHYLLATVDGAYNAIYVKGDFAGSSLSYGQGAGMLPTASAVVSDVIEIARNLRRSCSGRIPPGGFFLADPSARADLAPFDQVHSEYYLKFRVVDKPGVLSRIAGVLGRHAISIASVLQKGQGQSAVPIFIVTHRAKESDMRAALAEVDRLPDVLDRTRMIRIENNL